MDYSINKQTIRLKFQIEDCSVLTNSADPNEMLHSDM